MADYVTMQVELDLSESSLVDALRVARVIVADRAERERYDKSSKRTDRTPQSTAVPSDRAVMRLDEWIAEVERG